MLNTTFTFKIGNKVFPCSIGKNGFNRDKKEGDDTTPIGEFLFREVFYRADRITLGQLKPGLPCRALQQNDGWCDDINSDDYNKYITLPYAHNHENLWREDNIYDIIIVIGYNDNPILKGKGSAIFLHIARENYEPTAGCIALAKEDLLTIVPQLGAETKIKIDSLEIVTIN